MEQVERIEADNLDERPRNFKSYFLPLSVFAAVVGVVGHELLQAGPGRFGVIARLAFFLGLQVPLLTFAVVDQLRQGREWPVWKSISVPVLGVLISAAVTLALA
jgi:hypothetical protein